MPRYRVRPATLEDRAVLVHHRIAMFTDMGIPMDVDVLAEHFDRWLGDTMPSGTYLAWVVECLEDEPRPDADHLRDTVIAAGGGLSVLPWPPGPRYLGSRLAFVYNVYTEPAHRRRGLARLVMESIHRWCLDNNITSLSLNASQDGRPLYESLGYSVTASPMMFRGIG